MRRWATGLLLFLLCPWLTSNGLAQETRVVPILELTDEDLARIDLHDGSVGDWRDTIGEPSLSALDFTATSFLPQAYDPADLDFHIWLAWHGGTNRIYVAMERADDIYVNDFGQDTSHGFHYMMLHDSGIQFTVDGDGGRDPRHAASGGIESGTPEFYLLADRDSQQYLAIGERLYSEGPQVQLGQYVNVFRFVNRSLNPHGEWYLYPPYAEGGGAHFGEQPTVSITEFYVTPFDRFVWNDPQASQVSELEVGKIINVSIGVNDAEDSSDANSVGLEGSFYTPSYLDGLLVGAGAAAEEGPEEEMSVEELPVDSWGRIKASLDSTPADKATDSVGAVDSLVDKAAD